MGENARPILLVPRNWNVNRTTKIAELTPTTTPAGPLSQSDFDLLEGSTGYRGDEIHRAEEIFLLNVNLQGM